MHSEKNVPMEEIVCPHCGRPNLVEAEKCWYCQTVLKVVHQDPNSASEIPLEIDALDMDSTQAQSEETHSDNETNKDIPEWLKKVRELKHADQPEEPQDPTWHQEDIFHNDNPIDQIHPKKTVKPKQKISEKTEKLVQSDVFGDEKKPLESIPVEDDPDSKPNPQDLPEGFVKLNNDE